MIVNTRFDFLVEVRLSLNLANVRQQREKSQRSGPGSLRRKSATGEIDPGTAASDRQEGDSCPLVKGSQEQEEDLKLISETPQGPPNIGAHFARWSSPGSKPEEGSTRQDLRGGCSSLQHGATLRGICQPKDLLGNSQYRWKALRGSLGCQSTSRACSGCHGRSFEYPSRVYFRDLIHSFGPGKV